MNGIAYQSLLAVLRSPDYGVVVVEHRDRLVLPDGD